jgi:hypothetical protein
VDVISRPADRPRNSTDIADDAADVSVQFFTPWFCDDSRRPFVEKMMW